MCDHSNGWRPEDGVPDLSMMSDITAEGINVNLRTRYMRDEIYTFSGSILLAVNPYKQLNIYTNEWIARYRQRSLDQTDPHIFALTEAMYMNLVMQGALPSSPPDTKSRSLSRAPSVSASSGIERGSTGQSSPVITTAIGVKNQACVISGESGAGKTETTKFILSYLCAVTPNKSVWMEHQILEANTILEAFGNAKTVRNDNSSRFGKFIQICFDSRHQINGCIIQDYLLEQSRITYQSIGERNYHVFYQLLAAGQTNDELRRKFHLMPASFYEYLNKTQCYTIDGISDCAMFDSLRTAMSVLNMGQESCDGLFSTLSAVLWLGNLQFKCDEMEYSTEERCQFTDSDKKVIETISHLLGIEQTKLEPIMLKRQINVRGSITEIPFKLHEAKDNRNGMAKALYSRLFTWVVNFINASTNPGVDNTCFLGVLDIFGFENFETNSFEQLCINYANEKLHKFFNQHMFAMEQELYKREGIEFCDINYTDNTPCLELLEKPPNCILRLLSEECRMPKGSDCTLIEKLHSEFTSINPNPFYNRGNDRRNWSSEFSVSHFAGSVTYNVNGFLKKNKDAQQAQLFEIIESSSNPLLLSIVQCDGAKDSAKFSSFDETTNSSFHSRLSARQESVDSQAVPSNKQSTNDNRTGNIRSRLLSQHSLCNASPSASSSSIARRESLFDIDSSRHSSFISNSVKSKPTVADSFRQQLSSLVDLLSKVNPWYVRCIKPNLEKSAVGYDDRQVLMQLRYLGMSDLIKIRREGYPIHLTKHQFVCRYRCLILKHLRLNPKNSPIGLDEPSLHSCCLRMINHFRLDSNDWRIGKTMVLLRLSVYQPLEEHRNQLFVNMATLIQSFWRSLIQRRQFTKMKQSAKLIQGTFRAHRGRLLYLRKKRAVLTIQAYCRGMFAREIANAMREIKKVEIEKARKASEEQKLLDRQLEVERLRLVDETLRAELNKTEIVIIETLDSTGTHDSDNEASKCKTSKNSPSPNSSPAASSSASWNNQDVNEARQKLISARDRQEMEELVKVLEQHGISLDALEQGDENGDANLERLYDVLGSQIHPTCDTHSISTSVNDDDRCSFATSGTNGDGDSISCSGQSQLSSTLTDDHTGTCEKQISQYSIASRDGASEDEETVNHIGAAQMNDDEKYHSNSVESIASIDSSNSTGTANQTSNLQNTAGTEINTNAARKPSEAAAHNLSESTQASRTSTFTGNSLVVGGSKLVSNGRPLAMIEEEPNSIASSPSKTPCRMNPTTRPQSLFPPRENDEEGEESKQQNANTDIKRRRLERRIVQVQQNQSTRSINPTTAGVPTNGSFTATKDDMKENSISRELTNVLNDNQQDANSGDIDAIYGAQKLNILEFAERAFNNHPRDTFAGGTVMRTLTRRRRSVDTNTGESLTKAEMLTYNPTFTIPTSHIKMYNPHNTQLSCSIFKNLCKFMTGDSAKSDNEIRIIQSIVRNGIEKIELRDEIYIQIIRQLTNNPNNEYCSRLWVLLGLVSAAFPPSKNFLKHLFEYLKSKPRKDPSIACHAQFCLDNLQAPRLSARKMPPSPLEIQACKNLSNLSCKIHLLDGRCETLSVHPCDTAIDTMTKLAQKINLQSIEGWALYESYTSGASKYPHLIYEQRGDFERTVKSSSFMADLIATWQDGIPKNSNISIKMAQRRLDEGNFNLTFKKKIFRGPKIRNDPIEISLLYAQAVHNVVKKDCFFVDENLAVSLAGLQAQVDLGNATDVLKQSGGQSKKGKVTRPIIKTPAQIYDVENYICMRLRNQASKSKKDWCNSICQSHKQYHNMNEVFCKMRYLSMVIYHCPLYGTATFDVTYKGYQALDQNLLLGINAEGLVLIRSLDKALINAYRYADICQDKGVTIYLDEKIIQFSVRDRSDCTVKCLTFETNEIEEIGSLMISYLPQLPLYIRGQTECSNLLIDASFDQSASKKRSRLKMTLEDRMRTHQEVQSTRRGIIKSGKLRKPNVEEHNLGLLKHTFKKLSSGKTKTDKLGKLENTYSTLGRGVIARIGSDLPQTSSDYNIHSSNAQANYQEVETEPSPTEVSGATASAVADELMKLYPHRYWAYTKYPLKNSLLTIYDLDLEEAALSNFNSVLTFSGLLNYIPNNACSELSAATSVLDSSSIDSGIASQQSLGNANGKQHSGSPSSNSSNDIYDVCPKKIDEHELIRLAQSILDRCFKKDADILKNELFLQLIKQTTDHPDPNSEINKRHWQLLTLACSVTYPSDNRILSYLYSHLRRCSLDQVSDEGQYAQFTLRSLQGTLDTKGRKYAPSEMEILSTINCRRVYARVYFLDGQFQAVEFDPCATIAEVIDQIKQKIGLKPECSGYALFQPLDDDCEQVLKPEEKVGDAISLWENWQKNKLTRGARQQPVSNLNGSNNPSLISSNNGANSVNKASIASLNAIPKAKAHKFIFKKYLFFDNLTDLNDPVERELLYYQTVTCIKEDKFPVLEQEATILCALKAQIEIGDYTKLANLPREHIRMIYKQVVMSLMPPHSFNNLQVQSIAQQHQAFKDLNRIDSKKYFFNLIQSFGRANSPDSPGSVLLHRAHVYDAKQTFATAWPSDIWIVINCSGMHMLVARSRRILASCEYRQIVDYNSNNSNLMVIILTNAQNRIKYTFYTKQAQQITQQMKDYMVISVLNGNKRRKSVGFNLK